MTSRDGLGDRRPDFLTDEVSFAVVDRLGFHLRDAGLLVSALPPTAATVFGEDAYPDLATKAAALFESLTFAIIRCIDGNKRDRGSTWTFR